MINEIRKFFTKNTATEPTERKYAAPLKKEYTKLREIIALRDNVRYHVLGQLASGTGSVQCDFNDPDYYKATIANPISIDYHIVREVPNNLEIRFNYNKSVQLIKDGVSHNATYRTTVDGEIIILSISANLIYILS